MNTKIVMITSSIVMGLTGISLSFVPLEIMSCLGLESSKSLLYLLQILGALYFGFAMLNWMTKSSLIGAIYNRPIAIANFSHFLIAGLALTKGVLTNPGLPLVIQIAAGVYLVFAVSFGIILFRHPVVQK